jgi:thiol-disulfide isomerase/thioredoxin
MTPLVLMLSLAIVVLLAYRFWEPFTVAPKRDVPVGSATLYFFYTNWCGYSKKAMPEWEKLEAKLKESPVFGPTRVKAVRVDADQDRATTSLYGVEGYPTIKLETSSILTDYSGKRTSGEILAFLRDTLGQERKSL